VCEILNNSVDVNGEHVREGDFNIISFDRVSFGFTYIHTTHALSPKESKISQKYFIQFRYGYTSQSQEYFIQFRYGYILL
jgi:hypothetical protein